MSFFFVTIPQVPEIGALPSVLFTSKLLPSFHRLTAVFKAACSLTVQGRIVHELSSTSIFLGNLVLIWEEVP